MVDHRAGARPPRRAGVVLESFRREVSEEFQAVAPLDQVHAKHPDMVLLHGGTPKGAELIASRWADHRKVPQIAFKPDWTKHGKAAPFKRNDALLDTLPVGVLVFPGTGIQDNLADKAKKLGIPVMKFDGGA